MTVGDVERRLGVDGDLTRRSPWSRGLGWGRHRHGVNCGSPLAVLVDGLVF
jgi:hypothetical protein